jgi:hypothetical protein
MTDWATAHQNIVPWAVLGGMAIVFTVGAIFGWLICRFTSDRDFRRWLRSQSTPPRIGHDNTYPSTTNGHTPQGTPSKHAT